MPIRGIVNTARSLSYYTRLQEVTANNLANVNSDAFKADRVTAHQLPGAGYPVPAQKTDFQQGAFRETGRPLDVAFDGPGFLMVRTDAGDRLTRGGSLRLDGEGRLADAHGALVMGENGPIVVQGFAVEVQDDGSVVVDGRLAGRMRMVEPDAKATLLKEGAGRYLARGEVVPVRDGVTRMRQGAVEEPNVDPTLGMVDLVSIQRAYSANVDALKAMDSVLGVIAGEVGKV
jgi:flagellar basal body rod protein FlgG